MYGSEIIMYLKGNYLNINIYYKLKVSLIILYILNLSDLFFTKTLLRIEPNMFKKANVILAPIIGGIAPYFLKIIVVGLVLYYWYFRSSKSNEKEIKRSLVVSWGLLVFYILINCIHIFNCFLLIITD